MSLAKSLLCRKCGQAYPVEAISRCGVCLSPVEVTYDYEAMADVMNHDRTAAGPTSMWRYKEMLPVDGEVIIASIRPVANAWAKSATSIWVGTAPDNSARRVVDAL